MRKDLKYCTPSLPAQVFSEKLDSRWRIKLRQTKLAWLRKKAWRAHGDSLVPTMFLHYYGSEAAGGSEAVFKSSESNSDLRSQPQLENVTENWVFILKIVESVIFGVSM